MAANPGLFLLIFVLLFTIQLQMWNKFRLSKLNSLNVVLGIESVDTGLKHLFATLGDHLLAFSVHFNYKVFLINEPYPASFFLYFRQLTVNMFIINFVNDRFRHADLRYRKRPFCQLRHNHCLNFLLLL